MDTESPSRRRAFFSRFFKTEAAGELSSPRQAALPSAGAVGGLVVPVLIYVALGGGGIAQGG